MNRLTRQIVATPALVALLAACAAQQQQPATTTQIAAVDTAVDQFVDQRRAAARDIEADGDLAGALIEWRLLAAVKPRDREAKREIERLEKSIGERKTSYLRQADAAMSAGRHKEARTLYLKVLALDGSDSQATRRLRELEHTAVLANQKTKDEKALAEYRASHAKRSEPKATGNFEDEAAAAFKKGQYRKVIDLADQRLKNSPADSAAATYRQRAYLALAEKSQKAGNLRGALTYLEAASDTPAGEQPKIDKSIATLRTDIAAELYGDGLNQLNSNLDRAIELLAEALTFDPNHIGARQRLSQAQKMRTRLNAIK